MDKKLAESFRRNSLSIPPHTQEALAGYLIHGLPPGGFLTSMLLKELENAVFKADIANKPAFADIFKWVVWEAPIESWGTDEIMQKWMDLTDGQRREILVKNNLVNSVFEIISSKEETNVDPKYL